MKTDADATHAPAAWIRSYSIAGLILALALVAARAASAFIGLRFPDRPAPPDLFFELLPRVDWWQYVGDLVLIVGLALLIWYALRLRPHEGPSMMALVGLMQISRAAINVLTPLATPLGNGTYWGLVDYVQNGMFPSGHTGTTLLFYLFVNATAAPRVKQAMLGLFILEIVALLLSRGHYSIDIVGGVLLAVVLHGAWTRGEAFNWLRRLVTP